VGQLVESDIDIDAELLADHRHLDGAQHFGVAQCGRRDLDIRVGMSEPPALTGAEQQALSGEGVQQPLELSSLLPQDGGERREGTLVHSHFSLGAQTSHGGGDGRWSRHASTDRPGPASLEWL